VAFSLVSFVMHDYFLPLGTINFGKLYRELIFSNPELELESFTVKNYENTVIVTGEVSGRTIQDVVILDNTENGDQRVITAEAALLAQSGGDAGVVTLELSDVFTETFDPPSTGDYEYSRAEEMLYNILLKDITFSIRNPGPREMSSYDVWQVIRDRRGTLVARRADQDRVVDGLRFRLASAYYGGISEFSWGRSTIARLSNELESVAGQVRGEASREITDRTLQNYEIEFYKKFSIPAACLVFVIFAFPTGLLTRRAGRAVGFGIGLLMSTAYWSMLIAGQTLGGNNPQFPAVLAMWYPNAVVLLLGLVAFVWRSRR
jgi:lipopolysaccharide export system permease protein